MKSSRWRSTSSLAAASARRPGGSSPRKRLSRTAPTSSASATTPARPRPSRRRPPPNRPRRRRPRRPRGVGAAATAPANARRPSSSALSTRTCAAVAFRSSRTSLSPFALDGPRGDDDVYLAGAEPASARGEAACAPGRLPDPLAGEPARRAPRPRRGTGARALPRETSPASALRHEQANRIGADVDDADLHGRVILQLESAVNARPRLARPPRHPAPGPRARLTHERVVAALHALILARLEAPSRHPAAASTRCCLRADVEGARQLCLHLRPRRAPRSRCGGRGCGS